MPLTGDFQTMPLTDVLEWISGARRTGLLTVQQDEVERYAAVRDGAIVAFGSNDVRRDNLAHILADRGVMEEHPLEELIYRHRNTGLPVQDLLVAEGHLTAEELDRILEETARELIYDLFLWREGRFVFDLRLPALLPLHSLARPIDTRELLFEAVRLQDEWVRIRQAFPHDGVRVLAVADLPQRPGVVSRLARTLLEHATTGRTVGELCLDTGSSQYAVMRELYDLWEDQVIVVEEGAGHDASTVESMLSGAAVLLAEQQFDEAALLYNAVLNLDPQSADARGGLGRVRRGQLEELYRQLPAARKPVRTGRGGEVEEGRLGFREQLLLSYADGIVDVAGLVAVSPFPELQVLRSLKNLQSAGLISFR